MKFYIKDTDGTITGENGQIEFFSNEKFKELICEKNNCFLCGRHYSKEEFNNEHIIPRWVLRKANLFKEFITLPNNEKVRYDTYTIPCCIECNTFLGKNLEEKIQKITSGGIDSLHDYISENGSLDIFIWLSLIFLKTHLKDKYLTKHLDIRNGTEKISSEYQWGLLHHIHCMVRSIKTGATIAKECHGSLLILPAKEAGHYNQFDYSDNYVANTILLRFNNIAFIAVLDDSAASWNFFYHKFKKLTGHLCPMQLREVFSHFTLLNMKLKYRPIYSTSFDMLSGKSSIIAELPEKLEIEPITNEDIGEIVLANTLQFIKEINDPALNEKIDLIRIGTYQFLFNEDGEFLTNSMNLIESNL